MSLLPIRMQSSPPHRVALHAARVGPGLEDAVFLGGGAHAALRPVLADLDAMAALPELCDRRRAEPSLDDEAAGSRLARIEGTREVLVMDGGHIDRLLQDRKSVVQGQSASVRVDLGGRRNIKKKKQIN